MPELFVELFSEEIPARLQARAAEDLARLLAETLAPLAPARVRTWFGPRRLALAAEVSPGVAASSSEERGPRVSAPEQALAGFLRKHGAARTALRQDGDFWVLDKAAPALDAASLIAAALPAVLRRFPWPKSMRWGGTSAFTWVRPLRRIVCLLDGAVVPFALAAEGDDGHGLASADLTEGHRVHAPLAFAVSGAAAWEAGLLAAHVVADAGARAVLIREGIAGLAQARGLSVVEDAGLIEEVAGLVEWPVPLLGQIDPAFMDLPAEVMQVSMRVNQRYFALRDAGGAAAPWFAFVANLAAPDGGAAIVAGNERVLRARFADARHFWELDRRTTLADRVSALDAIVFQAELGSQGARVARMVRLAAFLAPLVGADEGLAARAALLAKADLTTGMVGEFPELQGVMGGYYARHDGEDEAVACAVRDHYAPKGAGDFVPGAPVSVCVALADKIDQLVAFFSIGQRPTGSGDPFALRRAALGVIRIVRENGLRFGLGAVLDRAIEPLEHHIKPFETILDPQIALDTARAALKAAAVNFIVERMQIALKSEGSRGDTFIAALAKGNRTTRLDIVGLLNLKREIEQFLSSPDAADLLAGYKRASNILRIEDKRDGPHAGVVDVGLLQLAEEVALQSALGKAGDSGRLIAEERYAEAMGLLAGLRAPLDEFFEKVTVNAEDPALRLNRLYILRKLVSLIDQVADFSAIEA